MIIVRTIVVSGYGVKISAKKETFLITDPSKKIRVSPSDIDQIIIVSGGVSITSRAIRLAMKHMIDILFLDSRGSPWARIYMSEPTATVSARRAQYTAYLNGDGKRIAVEIVRCKLMNQAGFLKSLKRRGLLSGSDYLLIEELAKRIDPGNILKIEAEAAHIYWQNIASVLPRDIGFTGRDHDAQDLFNISLNYSYAILYSLAWRYLVIAGLDPYAGFIHKDRSGRESLVYDFSEMFKSSLVDKTLVELFRSGFRPRVSNGLIDRADRSVLVSRIVEALNRVVREENDHNPKTLEQAMRACALRLASSLRSNSLFRGFVEKW